VKKAVRWLVIAVLVVLVIQNPTGADALARHAMTALSSAAHAVASFASGL
jgi:hypothetical protein